MPKVQVSLFTDEIIKCVPCAKLFTILLVFKIKIVIKIKIGIGRRIKFSKKDFDLLVASISVIIDDVGVFHVVR
jgi:hypothetical protein